MYDKAYYDSQKLEIQKEFSELVFETYNEIERLVIKKMQKTQSLTDKLKAIEAKEGESKKKDSPKEESK